MDENHNEYMDIVGIKTKGGFPTIELKSKKDVDVIKSSRKFYDNKTRTWYAYTEGFFYAYQHKEEDFGQPIQRKIQDFHKEVYNETKNHFSF